MEIGETYTFVQKDVSNYYHPMGFAYFADGAHVDVPELEPGESGVEDAPCKADNTCPAPMYYKDGVYLGAYSNLPGETRNYSDNFGLDNYEPDFFYPLTDWSGAGTYSIKLTFDDATYDKDIFYFCHVCDDLYLPKRSNILLWRVLRVPDRDLLTTPQTLTTNSRCFHHHRSMSS